jgi:hypothetical protein
MKNFRREPPTSVPDIEIDFGAAKDHLPQLFDPGSRKVRIDLAKTITKDTNISVILELVDIETGKRIDNRALWVAGPNANMGTLAAENQRLIARLLELAGKPTKGNVAHLIPGLAGLTFTAVFGVATDNRTGRAYNNLIDAHPVDAA